MVGIVIVITIMPLRFLVSFGKGHGSAWHQAGVVKCSTAEDTMGMVCTSIPTFRQMLAPSLPSLFASNGLHSVPCGSNHVYKANSSGRKQISQESELELAVLDCKGVNKLASNDIES